MSFIKRVLYQVRKYQLRKIILPHVNSIIFSENSSEHWSKLNVDEMTVLDLGIGRWGTNNISETSPVYFKNKNAVLIVGVDSDKNEVDFYKQYFSENYSDGSIFINKVIDNSEELYSLISNYKINAIKCDIEGAEIYLIKLKLQEFGSLKTVAVEYHSPLLLKQIINVNSLEWKFDIIDHSIFSAHPQMGVITFVNNIR